MSVCSICGLPVCFPDEIHRKAIAMHQGTLVKKKPKQPKYSLGKESE